MALPQSAGCAPTGAHPLAGCEVVTHTIAILVHKIVTHTIAILVHKIVTDTIRIFFNEAQTTTYISTGAKIVTHTIATLVHEVITHAVTILVSEGLARRSALGKAPSLSSTTIVTDPVAIFVHDASAWTERWGARFWRLGQRHANRCHRQ